MKSLRKRKFLDVELIWSANWPNNEYLPEDRSWIIDQELTFPVDDELDMHRMIFANLTH